MPVSSTLFSACISPVPSICPLSLNLWRVPGQKENACSRLPVLLQHGIDLVERAVDLLTNLSGGHRASTHYASFACACAHVRMRTCCAHVYMVCACVHGVRMCACTHGVRMHACVHVYLATREDHLARDEDEQHNLRLYHPIDETWEELRLILR